MFAHLLQRHDGNRLSTLAASPTGELRLGALDGLITGGRAVRDRVGARCGLRLADALGTPTGALRRSPALGQLHLGHAADRNTRSGALRCPQRSMSGGCTHVAF